LPGSGFRLSNDGEIQFKHGAVMTGYYRDVEKTREAFTADGWLRTGDRGRVDADGFLYITGRIKDEFKTGKGKYVSPVPIENLMARNTDLEMLCLVGAGLNQPILLATLSPNGKTRSPAELEQALTTDMAAVNADLDEHARIAKCLVVDDAWSPDNGLVTPTGKVKRADVESRYRAALDAAAARRDTLVEFVR
jgi:long-chain acyl-CoA synthetase